MKSDNENGQIIMDLDVDDLIKSLNAVIDLKDFDFDKCYKEVKSGGIAMLMVNIAHYAMRHKITISSLEIEQIELILKSVMESEND